LGLVLHLFREPEISQFEGGAFFHDVGGFEVAGWGQEYRWMMPYRTRERKPLQIWRSISTARG
jgi:hypothetical protein